MSFLDLIRPAPSGALLLAIALAAPATRAADFSADSLSLHPSCVLYQDESGVRALVNGAVVRYDRMGRRKPEAGVRQRFHLDGHTFTATTDDAGFYTADVAVSPLTPLRMKEGRAWDIRGRPVGGQAGSTVCMSPQVHVGPLEPVK